MSIPCSIYLKFNAIIDDAGDQFGLPFLPPSKSNNTDFKHGANMAITGATAMDAPFFRSLNLSDKIWNNGPVSFQLQWFQQIATSVCGQSKWTDDSELTNIVSPAINRQY
jgi:hypothetical protein